MKISTRGAPLRSALVGVLVLAAILVPTGASWGSEASHRTAADRTRPAACNNLAAPKVPGAKVVSLAAVLSPAGTVDFPSIPGYPPQPSVTDVPARCDVSLVLTHAGSGDRVLVRTWLPVSSWNGRFQGSGGGGFSADAADTTLAVGVKLGYAISTTDSGHTANPVDPSAWALDANGKVNRQLFTNFASLSVHDMTVVGKALTKSFYGKDAHHSYFNGCSTGGRQGLMEAQSYPDDYDGINATSPAIHWERFNVGDLWPQVVMLEERNSPTACEFDAIRTAAVAACDSTDGVTDGVITDPAACAFDARSLVGTTVLCDGQPTTISTADARVANRIWAGAPHWYGLSKGADFTSTATAGQPFPVSASWVKYFVQKDPSFDTNTMTYRDFARIFKQSQIEFNASIGSDNPDLSKFRRSDGKIITWHGTNDQLVPFAGTVDYRNAVQHSLGGKSRVNDVFRVFIAPGAEHCAGGVGPAPIDSLAALVKWVEKGEAPDTLAAATTNANGVTVTRDICLYPKVSTYKSGDPNLAASYRCRG